MSDYGLNAISEIWTAVRDRLPEDEVHDLADSMVSILMNYEYSLADIKDMFSHDSDVVDAVKYYGELDEWAVGPGLDTDDEFSEEYDDYDDEDSDEDW